MENHSPSRRCGELDNRGSHFHLATAWARALADQQKDGELASMFGPIASSMASNREAILDELNGVQGQSMDVGGYYQPDPKQASKAMRPSETLNGIVEGLPTPA